MIEDLVRAAADGDDDAIEELERLAGADPAALAPFLAELLDSGVSWPPTLFRAADHPLVQRIVDRVDAGDPHLHHLLLILAHHRGDPATAALRGWLREPPPGMDALPVDVAEFVRQGGRILTQTTARDLCGPVAFALELAETPPAPGDGCPWCASPLWTALDLDTARPEVGAALAHTGWSGRLRITTCFLCANVTTLYTDVTPDGGATWSARNHQPDHLPGPAEPPPALLPVVGVRRPTPYLASAWDDGGSTLGGAPDWIQEAGYPDCAACGQAMDYVGLIGGADLTFGEGAYYLFLHAPCALAAVNYQQS
ncbi:hypothetical protein [Longispora urticae]